MFAHQPGTAHLPRTLSSYNHPTTSRKNALNKENSRGLPTKTPSRAGPSDAGKAGLGTVGRLGLGVKTEGKNVLRQDEVGKGKGKEGKEGKEGMDIEPKRLFQSTNTFPPSKSIGSFPLIPSQSSRQFTKTPARPPPTSRKTHKTPAPYRDPAPTPGFLNLDPISATPLPSAQKRRRSRQSLSGNITPSHSISSSRSLRGSLGGVGTIGGQGGVGFQTPAPKGWEEEHSLESITEGLEGFDSLDGVILEEDAEGGEDSDDEIEYMPPKVQELPFNPGFDHPNLEDIFDRMKSLPMILPGDHGQEPPEIEIGEIEIVEPLRLKSDQQLEEPIFKNIDRNTAAAKAREAMKSTSASDSKLAPSTKTTKGTTLPTTRKGPIMSSLKPQASGARPRPTTTAVPGKTTRFAPAQPQPLSRKPIRPATTASGNTSSRGSIKHVDRQGGSSTPRPPLMNGARKSKSSTGVSDAVVPDGSNLGIDDLGPLIPDEEELGFNLNFELDLDLDD